MPAAATIGDAHSHHDAPPAALTPTLKAFGYQSTTTLQSSAALPQHLTDAAGVLLGEGAGLAVGRALGPHVGERLLGVRQHQRPAVVVNELHAVDQHDLAVGGGPLDERAH